MATDLQTRRGRHFARRPGAAPDRPPTPTAVRLLQIYGVLLFVIPSYTVFKPLGAAAFPAGILGMGAIGLWTAWCVLGFHNPLRTRTPIRLTFGALWCSSLLSYIALQFRPRDAVEVLGGDRWLLFLASITGIAFLVTECVPSLDDLKRVIRALLLGASFCAVVGILQYFFLYDLAPVLGRNLPGFTFNPGLGGIEFRSGLNRVPGTLTHPIEFGTTAAMLMPLALYMAIYDRGVSLKRRVVPAVLIFACIPISVSRSAVLGAAASVVVLLVALPARERAIALASIPVVLGGVFLTLRGIISTLTSYFGLGGADPSISTRTDDYPLVEAYVRQRPWFGRGGGTYNAPNPLEILDNQYLKWIIEFGIVGLVVLIVFVFGVPAAAAFYGRRRTESADLRLLQAALGAGVVSAALASATFDSLSFPVFACVYGVLLGCVGAAWRFRTEAVHSTESLVV